MTMRDKVMLEQILVELGQRIRNQSTNLAHASLAAIEQVAAAGKSFQDIERLAKISRNIVEAFAEFENLLRKVKTTAKEEAKQEGCNE